jgi:hypothetical protein
VPTDVYVCANLFYLTPQVEKLKTHQERATVVWKKAQGMIRVEAACLPYSLDDALV